MPINPIRDQNVNKAIHGQLQTTSIWLPDVRPDDNISSTPALFSQEKQDIIPPNFDQLPEDEKKKIMDRIRFRGIRCRHDIDEQVKVTRETLDIP